MSKYLSTIIAYSKIPLTCYELLKLCSSAIFSISLIKMRILVSRNLFQIIQLPKLCLLSSRIFRKFFLQLEAHKGWKPCQTIESKVCFHRAERERVRLFPLFRAQFLAQGHTTARLALVIAHCSPTRPTCLVSWNLLSWNGSFKKFRINLERGEIARART